MGFNWIFRRIVILKNVLAGTVKVQFLLHWMRSVSCHWKEESAFLFILSCMSPPASFHCICLWCDYIVYLDQLICLTEDGSTPSYDEFSDADLTFWVVTQVDKGEQVGTRGQDGAELLIFSSSPWYAVL